MKKAPDILSTFSLSASVNMTMMEANIVYKPVIVARFPDTVIGEISGPIPMENKASKIQLPMMSPIASLYRCLRIAVKSITNSGRDVPIATTKKLMRYSGI